VVDSKVDSISFAVFQVSGVEVKPQQKFQGEGPLKLAFQLGKLEEHHQPRLQLSKQERGQLDFIPSSNFQGTFGVGDVLPTFRVGIPTSGGVTPETSDS